MRIALFSDIHGNAIALDAVLADIERQGGVDEYWVLGDLVAFGPQPIAVLERLTALPHVRFVRGNTDRYITSTDRPPPHRHQVEADLRHLPIYEEVALAVGWTRGAVAVTGWLPFLDALPIEQRLTLPNGTRLLGVHASPGTDESPGIRPDYSEEEIHSRMAGCDADLVCVGHTHWPMNRWLNDVHIVNLGSVGNPQVPDLCAWYVMLMVDQSGYTIQHHQAAYDRHAVMQQLEVLRHPSRRYINGFLLGEEVRPWPLPKNDCPAIAR